MTQKSICPCDAFIHPTPILNRPGLSSVRYRVGDFATFREALLRPLPNELELRLWQPGAEGDLAVQAIEWLAYLADILTFYNERIVNQYYVRTADLPESVQRLVRILGYRPRPGIGAAGIVTALIKGPKPIVVPAGYQIQSKPGPGQTPQTFEVDAAVKAGLPDAVPADPPPDSGVSTGVLLVGEISPIDPGEKLLLLNRGWAAEAGDFAVMVTVESAVTEQDPRAKKNTRVTFTTSSGAPGSLDAQNFRLMRHSQLIGLWGYPANNVVTAKQIHLASLARQIRSGDPILIETGGLSPSATLALVTSYQELVWYANADNPGNPEVSPKPADKTPIPITHSVIGFTPAVNPAINVSATQVRFAWLDVGRVIAAPSKSAHGPDLTLTATAETLFPAVTAAQQVLVEDGANDGAAAKVVASAPPSASLALTDFPSLSTDLQAPLRILLNLLHVSRGKTVASEVLGGGDAAAQGQEFVLQKTPLTYLASADPSSPEAYRSTLRVWVDGVEWKEVPSFFGQAPDAAVFVTKEDEEQKTHVHFGDGVHGMRLPSGVNNVVASYRYESGAVVPEAGKLTVMLKSLPGLKAIVNPIAPAGGADADPPDRLRTLAPRSVLTFNRAVSGTDYEVIAAQTPGVARARAYWSFDAARQQTLVTLYVGDAAGAVDAARQALMRVMDPNRPLSVKQAQPISLRLQFAVKLAKGHFADPMVAAVKSALTDADRGLLGLNVARIGQTLFRSQIYEACLGVAGVKAVHNLMVFVKFGEAPFLVSGYRFFGGEGIFFQLAPDDLVITVEAASNA
jgi:hypothetical protein